MKNLIIVLVMMLGLNLTAQNGFGNPVKGANWNKEVMVNGVTVKQSGKISQAVYTRIHKSGTYDIQISGKTYSIEVVIIGEELILFEQYSNENRNYITLTGSKRWRHQGTNQWILATCGNGIAKIVSQKTKIVTIPGPTVTVCVPCKKGPTTDTTDWKGKYQDLLLSYKELEGEVLFLRDQNQNLKCQLDFTTKMSDIFIAYNNRTIKFKEAKRRLQKLANHPCAKDVVLKRKGNGVAFVLGAVTGSGLTLLVKSLFNTQTGSNTTWNHNPSTGDGDGPNWDHNPSNSSASGTGWNQNTSGKYNTKSYSKAYKTYKSSNVVRANSMGQF